MVKIGKKTEFQMVRACLFDLDGTLLEREGVNKPGIPRDDRHGLSPFRTFFAS
ncbi:hypothetical protein [Brevibacillus porteri]|uniref:hypothetical protein n=1 Tax=Brevibacillus porteri TaxID=2126350 RepID=UPI0013050533|nr:hypothetical protein [Brevibacillus porteri]MED1801869.1 hypothetical protein [Brevibacillus porteri]MED2135002.1 hypothetical protein [Brevibacillus porteri]MED2745522.1 hypothetical protein [Brevibacillus porteri]MED2815733.1 hypothetical protein [Brevibacillus porteri]MED2897570.1 hypothetical protein [Brevibacillus porteri]